MVVTILRVIIVVHAARCLQQLWELRRDRAKVVVEDHGAYGVLRGVRS